MIVIILQRYRRYFLHSYVNGRISKELRRVLILYYGFICFFVYANSFECGECNNCQSRRYKWNLSSGNILRLTFKSLQRSREKFIFVTPWCSLNINRVASSKFQWLIFTISPLLGFSSRVEFNPIDRVGEQAYCI